MNNPIPEEFTGEEAIGNKTFRWTLRDGVLAKIYTEGSAGPSLCFSMRITRSTRAVRVKAHNGWKLTLDQLEWVTYKCIELIRINSGIT